TEASDVNGLIKLYFRKGQHIRPVELMLAQGLGQLISNQLNVIAAEKLKTHIRDAELRNLQAQINPHFLFNTLHLISALIRMDPKKARHITVQLSHYMRFNLGLVAKSLVPLEKECDHLKAYIAIIQARFADRLHISFTQTKGISHVQIPPSSIQPLVENCIQHGFQNVAGGGKVEIDIRRIDQNVRVSIRDNGQGFPAGIMTRAGREPLKENEDG